MAKEFKLLRFNVPPLSAVNILPFDDNRQYLLVSCSAISSTALDLILYNFVSSNYAGLTDVLTIYQSGFYEPVLVPSNAISIGNSNATLTLSGFIYVA